MKIRSQLFAALLAIPLAGLSGAILSSTARAGDEPATPVLRVQDGRFDPSELVVKARTPFRLKVVNAGKDAIEFESFELNRERVVAPGQEILVYLPGLAPGTYKFFDDFHRGTGEGTIQAR